MGRAREAHEAARLTVYWRAGLSRTLRAVGIAYLVIATIGTIYTWQEAMLPWDPLAQSNVWRWDYFSYAFGQAAIFALWWGGFYAVSVAIARGGKWVARGFLDGER